MTMTSRFKATENLFKRYKSPEAAIKEGRAIDFLSNEGYNHVRDISLQGENFRLLGFDGFQGSYVIPNYLSREEQVELIRHCLSDCLKSENKTNLHGHTENSIISSVINFFNHSCPSKAFDHCL